MKSIIKSIKKFYKTIIKKDLEEINLNIRELLITEEENYIRPIAELIAGIAAQSDRRKYYLKIMEQLGTEESHEIFFVLNELIDDNTTKENEDYDSSTFIDNNSFNQKFFFKNLEILEQENENLKEENKNLMNKIEDLTKMCFNYELNFKETENKYTELLSSLQFKVDSQDYDENTVSLSIEISELKGKLEYKEKLIEKLKNEKESINHQFNEKINILNKQINDLKENSIKYEILKEKFDKNKFGEIDTLKHKLSVKDKILEEKEEMIKKLKNNDKDKLTLLKKIEDLNFEKDSEQDKINNLLREIEHYKNIINNYQQEYENVKIFKENITKKQSFDEQDLKNTKQDNKPEIDLNVIDLDRINTIEKLNEIENQKYLNDEKHFNEMSAITQKLSTLQEENRTLNTKIENLKKKLTFLKEENQNLTTKNNKLQDKNYELTVNLEQTKYTNKKEVSDIEIDFNTKFFEKNQTHAKEILSYKDTINRIENETIFLKKEIKKLETENHDLHKKLNENIDHNGKGNDNNLKNLERRLSLLPSLELNDVKRQLAEKEDELIKYKQETERKIENIQKMNESEKMLIINIVNELAFDVFKDKIIFNK